MTDNPYDNCLRVCSLNVRGIADAKKRKDLYSWLRNKQYNIYCLQDIHCGPKFQDQFRNDWGSDVFFSCKTSNARGVAILFNNNFEYSISGQVGDEDGNCLGLKVQTENHEFALVTIYGPNRDDPDFYKIKLNKMISDFEVESVILCGDFNLVQDQNLDTFGYIHENNKRASLELKNLMNLHTLSDPWRYSFPTKKQYSWRNGNNSKMSRLDFFLVSGHLLNQIEETRVFFGYKTDHSLIYLKIKFSDLKRGKGFWKLNISLLNNNNYVEEVKRTIQATALEYHKTNDIPTHTDLNTTSDLLFWEVLKMNIRSISIKFSSNLKKQIRAKQKHLENSINILESGLHLARDEVKHLYNKYKLELESIREHELQGALIRSKSQWMEFGEKPTKYFCNLEKNNYINKAISKLVLENGNTIFDQSEILNQQQIFYENLYTSKINLNERKHTDMKTFIARNCSEKLRDNEKFDLDNEFTENEVKLAIQHMKNGKTPGSDGLPVEFYKFFWGDIRPYLINSFKESFVKGELSINQRRGIISCIPKGNKDRTLLKNWRPITLLNSDYKIISNVLANRLKKHLPRIIHQDQKGFIKDRCIAENTRLVYDIIDHLNQTQQQGLLFLIDFEKAFDSIEWKFIEQTLEAFNFGNNFIRWFRILYYGSESCVINNGIFSKFFKLERGCRQGDPISPYLFILASEILANSIRTHTFIKGICINNKEFRIGQYADDTFLFMDGTKNSLDSAINCLKEFENFSGLKINLDKCEAIWLGKKKGSLDTLQSHIKFVTDFKLLGIIFPNNLKTFSNVNIEPKINEIEKLLLAYKRRNLSLFGRVTVVKTLAISKLIHLLQITDTPPNRILNNIEKMF